MVKIYQQPFAHAGTKQVIPDASDPQGFVSNEDGFTTDYELPDTDPNYKPIERAEFNGLMNMVTEAVGELQQFGFAKWQPITWPKGARVVEGGVVYRSLVQTSRKPPHADWVDDMGALNTKADKSVTITAGTGLSGGGDLSANRTLSVKYGTTAGTAAQGNDSRIVNAVQTSGNQTIAGTKTFTSFPVTPSSAPTSNYQAVNKKYVDDKVSGAAQKSANLSDISSAADARQNLGLGTAATRDVTTSATDTTAGRLLKVGDFGLGTIGAPPNAPVTDLNDLNINGVFNVTGDTPNWPFGGSGGVVQQFMHRQNQYITQIAYSSLRDEIRTRTKTNTTAWTSWKDLLHTGNIQSTTGQSTSFPMTQKAVTDAINNSAIGVGQTWKDMTSKRVINTTYTNTTGRPIAVSATGYAINTLAKSVLLLIDGVAICKESKGGGGTPDYGATVFGVVPNGSTYRVNMSNLTLTHWFELI